MGEFIVDDVHWKKEERGIQKFILFESDGITRRDGTGKTYVFSFWKRGATSLKGTGTLVPTDTVQGEYDYNVLVTDTDTVFDHYLGELIEDPATAKLKSESFKVIVEASSAL